MRISLLLAGLALLLVSDLRAQHCAYDMATAIVIQPRDPVTGEVICGLRLTAVDSLGRPLHPGDEALRFHNCLDGDLTDDGPRYESLWFMRGSYGLYSGLSPRTPVRVMIEDLGTRGDTVTYEPVTITIEPKDIHSLCTQVTDWQRGVKGEFARTFRPVPVWLKSNRSEW